MSILGTLMSFLLCMGSNRTSKDPQEFTKKKNLTRLVRYKYKILSLFPHIILIGFVCLIGLYEYCLTSNFLGCSNSIRCDYLPVQS